MNDLKLGYITFKTVARGIGRSDCDCHRKIEKGEKYVNIKLCTNQENICIDCWNKFIKDFGDES